MGVKKNKKNKTAVAYMYSATSHAPESSALAEQSKQLHAYAEKSGLKIVKTYADEGGTRENREKLMLHIALGTLKCDTLLLRDVTRWGRFKESGDLVPYETLCRRAGIQIVYVSETPYGDGGMTVALFKAVRRMVMEEYGLKERAS